MDIPGVAGKTDREAMEKAQAESERLLEELKSAVKTETKDIGVLRKELRITVPAKTIADHMEHNYDELVHEAFVPGFRQGRAPRRLIEKRFGSEVRESLTSSIVGQSYFAATENEKLDVLGDPLFVIPMDDGVKLMDIGEALQHIKLPEAGDFVYACEVELKPTFTLPELKGIQIKTPEIEITDEMVTDQILRRRKIRGRMELISDGAAERDDQLVADVTLTVDGQEVKREENVALGVRPTRLDGIPLLALDEVLAGVKPGDTRTTDCQIGDDYERADLRGKAGQFTFNVHEVKRLVPEPLESFLQAWGYENEQVAREDVRAELASERNQLVERAKKAQVEDYLLKNTTLDLPEHFSARQTDRAVMRRVIELQRRGVPIPDIEARIDELRTSARAEVANELKLGFILEKVAEQLDVHVNDEEVNTEIARIAQLYNRRFDRVRDDLQARGLLTQLVDQIRDNKCVAILLEQAQFVAATADKDEESAKPKKKSTRKKKDSAAE